MCKQGDEVILEVPEHIKPYRVNKDTVCIDRCIVPHIKHLWSCGIVTLGCCCGHGIPEFKGPTIIIGEEYDYKELHSIYEELYRFDSSVSFLLKQWRTAGGIHLADIPKPKSRDMSKALERIQELQEAEAAAMALVLSHEQRIEDLMCCFNCKHNFGLSICKECNPDSLLTAVCPSWSIRRVRRKELSDGTC